jgi:serine phosphatase RsbU (regulator of sigma subunit)
MSLTKKFPELKNQIVFLFKHIFLGKSEPIFSEEYKEKYDLKIDKRFAYIVFITQFSFFLILFYLPPETVPVVFVNHIGITLISFLLALFAYYEILVSLALNVLLTMIHIIIFLTIGQLQYLMNGGLSVEYLNGFYISLSILIMVHAFRFHQSSCIIPGISFIFFHLISLFFLSRYSDDFLSIQAFLPEGSYVLSMLVGTGIIIFRRKDLKKIEEMNREKSVFAQELQLAKKVQDTLFPVDAEINGLKFEVFRQSHNFIGGDFYDFIQLREGNTGIFLTDIAGHGISSAMVASIMKVVVATIPYRLKLDPVKLLAHLDVHLERNLNSYHASAIYLFIDYQTKTLSLGNAGHPYLIYCPVGGQFREIETNGSILGFHIRDPIVDQIDINFNVGDRFFMYTDGLVESPTETNSNITEEDLLTILNNRRNIEDIAIIKELIIEDIYKNYKLKHFTDDTMFLLFELTERS